MEKKTAALPGTKIAEFQGLRAVALAGIIFYHYGNAGLSMYAVWGVSLFFMLSGYLNGLSWSNGKQPQRDLKSSVSYMLRHVKKLYLLHVIMTLASIFESGVISDVQAGGTKKLVFWGIVFLMNVTLTKSLYPKYYWGYNGVSWFLSTYAVLCLLTPVLLHITARLLKNQKDQKLLRAVKVMAAIFAVQFIYCFMIGRTALTAEYWVYIFPLSRVGEYVIGMIAGMCSSKLPAGKGYGAAGGIAAVWIAVMMFCVPMPEWLFRSIVWIIPNVLLLWGIHRSGGILPKLLSCRLLVILGDYSAYMYLIHQVVYGYFFCYGFMEGSSGKRAAVMLLNYALTFALAAGYQRITGAYGKPFGRRV